MNNQQFRDLLKKDAGSSPRPNAPSSALGTKKSSFVPMTPRAGSTTSNADFARQVRERHAGLQPTKKFKSSVPMGSRFAEGYTDRAKARAEAERVEEEDKAKRIKALEEQVKLGNLSQFEFDTIREKITSGDATSAPVAKGLDFKLLERTRRGEDVLGQAESEEPVAPSADVDAELEKVGEKEIKTVQREKVEKAGIKGTSQVVGVKRSRDQIMAELKAKRQADAEAKAAAAPVFDKRWRKVGEQAKPRIEIDHKGREVLITVDEDGIVKRKVRKLPSSKETTAPQVLDKTQPVLGADFVLPEKPKPVVASADEEDEDEDIFAGIGAAYNPLGDEAEEEDDDDDDDDDSSEIEEEDASPKHNVKSPPNVDSEEVEGRASHRPLAIGDERTQPDKAPRNYFNEATSTAEHDDEPRYKDVENIIKKAAQIGSTALIESEDIDEEEKRRREKRAKMLAQDRDLDDMDMGFGSSRFDDEEDGEDGRKPRLSQWNGGNEDWDDNGKDGGKRKRKPKKRKGDVNNADDVMRVLEGRRAGKGK